MVATSTMQTCKLVGQVSSTCRKQCGKKKVSQPHFRLHKNYGKKENYFFPKMNILATILEGLSHEIDFDNIDKN
jgi:hypothetical protein